MLVVPKLIDDETIISSAKFRDGGRFPVLSYRHKTGVRNVSVIRELLVNQCARTYQSILSFSG